MKAITHAEYNVSPMQAHPNGRAVTTHIQDTQQGHETNKTALGIVIQNNKQPGFTGTALSGVVPRGTVKGL